MFQVDERRCVFKLSCEIQDTLTILVELGSFSPLELLNSEEE